MGALSIRGLLLCVGMCACDIAQAADANRMVSLHWGLPDTTAILGQLFQYRIPVDAFTGDILAYQVSTLIVPKIGMLKHAIDSSV